MNNKKIYSIEEINKNENKIVINFSEKVDGEINAISCLNNEKPLSSNIKLSSDGLSCKILFSRALVKGEDYGEFTFDRNVSVTGKKLKITKIEFR